MREGPHGCHGGYPGRDPSALTLLWMTRIRCGRPRCPPYHRRMFVFFSNRLGCLGSVGVSLLASIVLILLLRGCNGAVSP